MPRDILTSWPQNEWVSRTHGGTFLCQVWWSYLHRFLRYRAEKNRQTDKRRWKPYPATAVGVCDNSSGIKITVRRDGRLWEVSSVVCPVAWMALRSGRSHKKLPSWWQAVPFRCCRTAADSSETLTADNNLVTTNRSSSAAAPHGTFYVSAVSSRLGSRVELICGRNPRLVIYSLQSSVLGDSRGGVSHRNTAIFVYFFTEPFWLRRRLSAFGLPLSVGRKREAVH